MKRIRMIEEAIANNYNNDIREMHTPIHLYNGQEAVAVGVCSELRKEDVVFSNHRCHGHYLAKGGDLNKMMAELHNRKTGCCKGHGGSMHLMDKENGVALASAIVAGNVSIATGFAMAEKMKKTTNIAVVFFGDGASEEGSVYESICFAKLMNLPIVFVCENNLYSIATPMEKREPNQDISSKNVEGSVVGKLTKEGKSAYIHTEKKLIFCENCPTLIDKEKRACYDINAKYIGGGFNEEAGFGVVLFRRYYP